MMKRSWHTGLCLVAMALGACFGPGTAQEGLVAKDRDAPTDAGPYDTGIEPGEDCSELSNTVERLRCMAEADGSSLEDIIQGILGGGGKMDCSAEKDPIASLLCGLIGGGGGLEGLLGAGLGSVLADGGVERILIGAISEVIRGILDDLTAAFLEGIRPGDGGTPRRGIRRESAGRTSTFDSSLGRPGTRSDWSSAASCDLVTRDDLLGRLDCARQALDRIDAQLAEQAAP